MLTALLVWFIVYVFLLIQSLFQMRAIRKICVVIIKFLNSARIGENHCLEKSESYSQVREELLAVYPYIVEILPYPLWEPLSYSMGEVDLYKNAHKNYLELLMEKNYQVRNLKARFNPLTSLKLMFSMPSQLFKWMGFDPSDVASKFINLLGWAGSFFIGLYSDEIKILIAAIFHNFVN